MAHPQRDIMSRALAWMKARSGLVLEDPPGSNRTRIWTDVHPTYQGQPWCAAAVIDAYLQSGVDLRPVLAPTPYYCPTIEAVAKRRGWWKTSGQNAGDLVLYGSTIATHIGMSSPGPDPLIWAYEGNTSPQGGGGSQTNGTGLYLRGRGRSWIRGWVDMERALTDLGHPAAGTPTPPAEVDASALQRLLEVPATGVYDQVTAAALASLGAACSGAAVDAHARVAVDVEPDASPALVKVAVAQWLKALQALVGTTADGQWGPKTKVALEDYVARLAQPTTEEA